MSQSAATLLGVWRIWRAELVSSRLWAALCEVLSGRDLAGAFRRWLYDNPE